MKQQKRLGLKVSLIIFFGVLISSVFIYFAYDRNISDHTKSIAELSATNIYSEINNELTKPIYVALTMANDAFVIDWLANEAVTPSSSIITYLAGIQSKYDYSSVFLVSDTTYDYYRYTGYHKTISNSDDHDVWYFDFINSSDLYALDVDVDQANNILTIFVNAKILNDQNELMAVVGVGVEMNYIQEMISSFETQYELEAFLINNDGLIQSHSNTEFIESREIFKEDQYKDLEDEMKASLIEMNVIHDRSKYVISRYVDELNWYIVVLKDTNVLTGFIRDYFGVSFAVLLVILTSVYYMVNHEAELYEKTVFKLAKTDYLTQLDNRRGFDDNYSQIVEKRFPNSYVFMIDIDNFKKINDLHGHVVGDKILKSIALMIHEQIKSHGSVSRWGGDEFAGIFIGDENNLLEIINQIATNIKNDQQLSMYDVSLSIGYTTVNLDLDVDSIVKQVDQALYKSKLKGGNTITKH